MVDRYSGKFFTNRRDAKVQQKCENTQRLWKNIKIFNNFLYLFLIFICLSKLFYLFLLVYLSKVSRKPVSIYFMFLVENNRNAYFLHTIIQADDLPQAFWLPSWFWFWFQPFSNGYSYGEDAGHYIHIIYILYPQVLDVFFSFIILMMMRF